MKWLQRLRNPQRIFGRQHDPYMTRFFFPREYRLHIFYRGDQDRDPHDHPYDFDTFPLRSYWEERWHQTNGVWFMDLHPVQAFRWHRRKAEHTHRVLDPTEKHWLFGTKIVTIVKGYPVRRKWGFWVPHHVGSLLRRWVPWREYLGAPPEQQMSDGHRVDD